MSRIAIVEDDIELSRLIRDVLRDSGHEVISYMSPSSDILEYLKESKPDLLILDLGLNEEVSGWDILQALKSDENARHISIIVSTGNASQVKAHSEWLRAHGVSVLAKPFDIDELEERVDALLAPRPA